MPYPADYGGVIDVFYKIKALHNLGIKIHLHCFEYGRGEQAELNKYCVEVNYYKRKTGVIGFSFSLPYIVTSRANKKLLKRLSADDYPILLEGIHCTYFLYTGHLKNRNVFVRLHNVEFEYYRSLAKNESSLFKKSYFEIESRLLKKYEKAIANRATVLSINRKDSETYQTLFGAVDIKYLPAFVPGALFNLKEGRGNYCLYHGNLSIAENEKSAAWLSENVFNHLNNPFVIAGKNSSKKLQAIAEKNKNISLVNNPSQEEMNERISNAQINILSSYNSSGIKIKLLTALFNGRHCIVNNATVSGTGLESLCHIAETQEEFKREVTHLFNQPFTMQEMEIRKNLLKEFDNKMNAELLIQWIY